MKQEHLEMLVEQDRLASNIVSRMLNRGVLEPQYIVCLNAINILQDTSHIWEDQAMRMYLAGED